MTSALWVSNESPSRHLGGGNIRQAHLLGALARRAETHLLLAGELQDGELRMQLSSVTEVAHRTPVQQRNRSVRRVHDVWNALTATHPADTREARLDRSALTAVLPRFDGVDLVVVVKAELAPLASGRAGPSRWALQLHDVASQRMAQAVAVAPGRRQRWLYERERAKARRLERWAVRAYDTIVAVSEEDARALGAEALVVPNGVDIEEFQPSPLPAVPRLVFTGTLGYPPNIDGARWFCTEVLPRVRRAVPAATVALVGRSPAPEAEALAGLPGVELHADVPSVVPHLRTARVAIVPLRIGSGTRLKALEAMAAGRPVVGTTIGLEGIGALDGKHVLVADDAAAQADAVVALLRDDDLARRLAREARALVEQRYRWDRIADRFTDALLSRLSTGRAR